MLQVVQYQKNGEVKIEEFPAPNCQEGHILVRTFYSLISAGTEKTSVTNSQGSLLSRAKKQPDQVKVVLDTIKKQGLAETVRRVQNKLDSFKVLGYSLSGVVIESKAAGFAPGDRVACGGAGYANHAEIVSIPKNLAVHMPADVSFADASYTTVASIAMQGVRQAEPRLGETVAVIGLGLIGQITVQLLKAAGCRVVGLDIDESLFRQAVEFGCDRTFTSNGSSVQGILSFTDSFGCDSVIITAGTPSSAPVQLAMDICRQKGNVVIVGAVGMDLQRNPFYKKEISLKMSCSYGPGRYDPAYEEEGHDYPFGYVRWTENRNMQSVLSLIAEGKLDVKNLTSHTFDLPASAKAYDIITGKAKESYQGILLKYDTAKEIPLRKERTERRQSVENLKIGFIGLGQFAGNYLMPPIKKAKAELTAVATSTPANAASAAKLHGFRYSTTGGEEIISDENVNMVFCASRHDTHGSFVKAALQAGKPVFVEKPLCINPTELEEISALVNEKGGRVMVGFNRRFSPAFAAIKKHFTGRTEPMVISYRVNAGYIPSAHWTQAPAQGGRIIGEGCHFIDVFHYLTGAFPVRVFAETISSANPERSNNDSVMATVKFSDGSVACLEYLANGDSALAKEYCEVFCERSTAVMNNFETVDIYKGGSRTSKKFDGKKGIDEEVALTLDAVKKGAAMPMDYAVIESVTKTTFAIIESLRTGMPVHMNEAENI